MFEINQHFSENEINVVINNENREKYKGHPAKTLFQFKYASTPSESDYYGYTFANVGRGLHLAATHEREWFEWVKKRILAEDAADASSALSELRTYGCLRPVFSHQDIKVHRATNERSSDFSIVNGNETVFIETHCKRINEPMRKRLAEWEKEKVVSGFKEIVVRPFGNPKTGETTTENAIQKLAQIKQDEKQASDRHYSILWVDMQDDSLRNLIRASSALPIRSWRDSFTSGEMWYSCYGNQGLPILESERVVDRIVMRHDGKFSKEGSKFDCCIFSLPNANIFFENPYSKKTISGHTRYLLLCMPWVKMEHSWLRFPIDDLAERVTQEKERIEAFCKSVDALYGTRTI